jgi:NTE family protein/lysophospholipid hydrolase
MREPFAHPGMAISQKLCSKLDPLTIEAGETLFRQGEPGDAVFIVVGGQLSVSISQADGSQRQVGVICPCELAGEIPTLGEGRHTTTVRALCRSKLLRLSGTVFEKLTPDLIQELHGIVRQRLRRSQLAVILQDLFGFMAEGLFAKVEQFLEWVHIQRGEVLYRRGDQGDSLYIIVSGRLQALVEDVDGPAQVVGEMSRGEIVGERALFTGDRRTRTIRCIRDSDLVRVSRESFEKLIDERPQLMMTITRLLVRRMHQSPPHGRRKKRELTFAVLAAHPDVSLCTFAERLSMALSELAPTLHLDGAYIDDVLQIKGISRSSEEDPYGLSLSVWLDEQESRYRYIVYEADKSISPWTRRCIQRADHIIVVARAGNDPAKGGADSSLALPEPGDSGVKKTLVLLHRDRNAPPLGSSRWMDCLGAQYLHHVTGEAESEYRRLARMLTGNGFGLVLSGGGANGFAHIGVIRALKEAGVPIDMIGGVSMGAVIAAQYAMGMDWKDLIIANRKMWIDAKPAMDITLPLISLLSCRRLDEENKMCFGQTMIEDLWLDFFCVSTNLTTARQVIHRRGPVCRAVRASCALPGITPPVVEGSDLLVDGAVLNNLPVDVMREIRDCLVIAVDVTDNDEFSVQQETAPSPLNVLRGLFDQSQSHPRFPNLIEIITRTTLVSSIHKTQSARADADLYFRPPLQGFNLLDLSNLDKIVQVGYEFARERIGQWKEKGCIK